MPAIPGSRDWRKAWLHIKDGGGIQGGYCQKDEGSECGGHCDVCGEEWAGEGVRVFENQ